MSSSEEQPIRKKSVRPESTMALNFSDALDGLFNLGGGLPDLSVSVEERKRSVNDSSRELQELEARLKAAEERLNKAGIDPSTLPPVKYTTESQAYSHTNGDSAVPPPPNREAPPHPAAGLDAAERAQTDFPREVHGSEQHV